MKLLNEILIINEDLNSKQLVIDGSTVFIKEFEAKRGFYAGKLLFHASDHGPEEWSDDQDAHLMIGTLEFSVKTKDQEYSLGYDLGHKDFLDNGKPLTREFIQKLSSSNPVIYDSEDDDITDPKTVMFLKSLVTKYAQQFDCIEYIYDNTSPAEVKPASDY